ncbi:50S ribosomal protein L9 [Candidatus Shikimatogenerans bostrichidophilus]|uniref:50S ribosomal protein L9 n=1 Tax=Candidatus Shikimatogenerans bostrichidophilus TaxID=2943807 RepID=UPI0029672A66
MIKIILKKNIKNLGLKNEIKIVKFGYAINYLIPKNYAVIATKLEIKKNNEIIKQKKKIIDKINKNIEKLKKLNIIFKVKTKKNGIIYGTITKKDIINKLKENNIKINKNNILLKKKIRRIGNYKIIIKYLKYKSIYIKINVLNN